MKRCHRLPVFIGEVAINLPDQHGTSSSRRVKLGQREIILQRTTPRNMATARRKSGTIIQALRHLGQDQVDDKVIAALQRQITTADRSVIRKDLRYAPAWIADILRRLSNQPS